VAFLPITRIHSQSGPGPEAVVTTRKQRILPEGRISMEGLAADELHFETDEASATALDALKARPPDQPVFCGKDSLFAKLFPSRLMVAPPDRDPDLRMTNLHLVTGVLASCCARTADPCAHTIGSAHAKLAAMVERMLTAVNKLHVRVKPYTAPEWRRECEAKLRSHANELELSNDDFEASDAAMLPMAPQHDPALQVTWTFQMFRICSHATSSPLLHNYGEMVDYVGPHYHGADQIGMQDDGKAGYKLDYVFTALVEAALVVQPRLPTQPARREMAVQQVLERSRWPEIIEPCSGLPASYLEVHDRATLYINSVKRMPGDDMVELLLQCFPRTLASKAGRHIKSFLGLVQGESADEQCFLELRRLMPCVEEAGVGADLNSPRQLEILNVFLGRLENVWSSEDFKKGRGSGINGLVAALMAKVKVHNQISAMSSILAGQPVSPDTGAHPGLALNSQLTQLMLTAVTSDRFIRLEDRLLAHEHGTPLPSFGNEITENMDVWFSSLSALPWWYSPIRDITMSGCAIALKYLLKAPSVKSLPCKSCLYIARLRHHFTDFFNLRVIWDERASITTEMLSFKPHHEPSRFFRTGSFTQSTILVSIVAQERKQVKKAKGVDFSKYRHEEILVDSRKLEQYKKVYDRALSAVGYPSVERAGSTPNSHGAVVDLVDGLLELGEGLSDSQQLKMRAAALKFLLMAEKEAELMFKSFLLSEDPTAELPLPYLSVCSLALLYAQKKRAKVTKHIQDKAFSSSSEDEAAALKRNGAGAKRSKPTKLTDTDGKAQGVFSLLNTLSIIICVSQI
jgi:hypothetical protein